MQAKIQWTDNARFSATAGSGHEVLLDGGAENSTGFRPMEMLLIGLGGCTSVDVLSILRKSRQEVVDCVTEITATRASDPPMVFEQVHVNFKVTGRNLKESAVRRATSLSAEKYCSASIMLERGGVKITHGYEIIEADAVV